MGKRRSESRVLLVGLTILGLVASPPLVYAQSETVVAPPSPVVVAPAPAVAAPVIVPAPTPPAPVVPDGVAAQQTPIMPPVQMRTVRLSVDGNLSGRVTGMDGTGKVVPMRAEITFLKPLNSPEGPIQPVSYIVAGENNQVASTTRSDEWGNFQASGLSPGVYHVVSEAGTQAGQFSVAVLEYSADATREEQTLDLSMAPYQPEMPMGPEMMGPPMAGEMAPMMGGGGGGGGGGGMGLALGAAGLAAGIAAGAALGDDGDGNEQPASPFFP